MYVGCPKSIETVSVAPLISVLYQNFIYRCINQYLMSIVSKFEFIWANIVQDMCCQDNAGKALRRTLNLHDPSFSYNLISAS